MRVGAGGRRRAVGLKPRLMGLVACTSVVAMALAGAPPAHADKEITAGPTIRYLTPNVTMDQGERVTFVNNDVSSHDVASRARGADGRRLFSSRLVDPGESAPVAGTEYLTAGSYAFFCTLHPSMEGTLNVTSAGAPVERPRDTRGPSMRVRVLDSRISRVRRKRALRVRVRSDEAANVRLSARRGRRVLAKGVADLSAAGSKTVALKLTRAGRRALARARRTRISLAARGTDRAGNVSRATARATLRR